MNAEKVAKEESDWNDLLTEEMDLLAETDWLLMEQ